MAFRASDYVQLFSDFFKGGQNLIQLGIGMSGHETGSQKFSPGRNSRTDYGIDEDPLVK
jgi:hypothetical protein